MPVLRPGSVAIRVLRVRRVSRVQALSVLRVLVVYLPTPEILAATDFTVWSG